MPSRSKIVTCQICKREIKIPFAIAGGAIRSTVAEVIKDKYPDFEPTGYICLRDLKEFRREYIETVVEQEKGQLSALDQEVVKSLAEHETLAENINTQFESQLTLGERIADKVAAFGGSWMFIITFIGVILAWVVVNSVLLIKKPFDPYPFILLNLFLSMLAAAQAPIIMMSQNRQEAKDRLRSQHDYKVNLKAELEIRYLHEKMDHLLQQQWQHLMGVQQLQLDLMEEIAGKRPQKPTPGTAPQWNKLLEIQQVQLDLLKDIAGKKEGPNQGLPPVSS